MYRCPICGNVCNFSVVPTYDGAIKIWSCPWCEWDSSNIEMKKQHINGEYRFGKDYDKYGGKDMSDMCTDNPYTAYSSAHEYFRGKDDGRAECKEELKEIIESMAYEIAQYRNPRYYDHSKEEIESIMREFGWEG